jgi:VWFA-related protein
MGQRAFWRLPVVLLMAAWPAAQQTAAPPQQGAAAAQPPVPQLTFRLETNYIEVDAVVTDAQGRFVRDLTRDDFEVREDDRTQTIDLFSLVDIPLERPDRPGFRATPVAPDVVTNYKPFEGRIYVLLLDANHVPATDTYLVKKAAHAFIDYLGANDLAAVVLAQTGSRDDNQEFTNSRAALHAAVDKFIGEKVRSRTLNVQDAVNRNMGLERLGIDPRASRDPEAVERAAKARATLDSIMRLSNYMAGIRGRRKAVILFSEGLDFNLDDTVGPRSQGALPRNPAADNTVTEAMHASAILDGMQAMFEAATRANVAIYSIDPRGTASEQDTLIQATGMPETSPVQIGEFTAGAREELRRQIGTLRTFSEVTGGLALVGTNDFAGGFRRIVQDNSAYYVLGYHPPEIKHDGKFHNISVRVKRPGLEVRARRGYYALKEAPAAAAPVEPTVALLNSPMPVGGLGLRLTASAVRASPATARVFTTIEVDGRQVTIEGRGGGFATKVDLAYAALDMSGNVKASGRKSLDLVIRQETRQSVSEHGLRLVTEFELAPGRYQLRLAAHEPMSGQSGSVFWDLEIPDFGTSPLAMSQLLVSSAGAARTPTSPDAPGLKGLLPGPPTAIREFALEDTLAVYAEIYDNDTARPHTVDLSATVRTDDGTQVFVTREERLSRVAGADRSAYPFLVKIPLHDLVPGRYVLTIEARSRLGGEPATRDTQFTVR